MTDETERELDHTYAFLIERYGNRLSPEMAETLRVAVGAVMKTVSAVRAVPLANGDAPLLGFSPIRKEQ